jgi:hypothetical protein
MEHTRVKTWKEYVGSVGSTAAGKPDPQDLDRLNRSAAEQYYEPSAEQMAGAAGQIRQVLAGGEACLVIPMKERGPVVRPLLKYLQGQSAARVCVVNDRSDRKAVETAKSYPVKMVEKDDLLDLIDWERLLPVLNLEKRPLGKGMTVLAGYLTHFLFTEFISGQKPRWLLQHDSELVIRNEHNNLDYLLWCALNSREKAAGAEKVNHIKVAKYGRANETVMAARSSLLTLKKLPGVQGLDGVMAEIQNRAEDLFEKLSPLKWMLSGQFALSYDLAMDRPLASGYLEETLLSTYVQDRNQGSGEKLAQVVNPYPCPGGESANCKEYTMFQQIINFLFYLAYFRKPVNQWTLEDIAEFNRRYLSEPELMALIPENDNPVYYQRVQPDRILPPVNSMARLGLLDLQKGRELIREIYKNN